MKLNLKNELLVITCLSFFLLLNGAYLPLIRIVLGLPFVLFFPGYALTAALYPGAEDITGLERLVLSIGLSVIIVPLIGVILNYMPWGINVYPFLISLTIFISIFSYLGWWRRRKLPQEKGFQLCVQITWQWSELSQRHKAVLVSILVALFFLLGTSLYILFTDKYGESFTEFYMVNQKGMAAEYPKTLKAGDVGQVRAVIVNQEKERTAYRLEVLVGNVLYEAIAPISLNNLGKWEKNITFKILKPGQVKVRFSLFKIGQETEEPYRRLELWVNVLPQKN
jgi:uncharacterized membrane protein